MANFAVWQASPNEWLTQGTNGATWSKLISYIECTVHGCFSEWKRW